MGWYVVAATAVTSILRARVWDSAACKAWLLAQPYLVAGVLLVFYTATGRYAAALGAVLVLSALVLGVGGGRAEPAHRVAGELFAAAAPAAGLCRRRPRCFADPRHGVSGRFVQLGTQSMMRLGLEPGWPASQRLWLLRCGRLPPALAISPPAVDPGVPPPSGSPGPVQPMEQRGPCSTSGIIPGTDPGVTTPSQAMLNLPAAWQFSRGDGQLVAVIDTGVRPGPRLPNVDPGGDFVETTDGLTDCDGHGTLVAGIIAGQPAPSGEDGFSGVAPAARVLSIRVTSAKFSPRTPGGDPMLAQASLEVATLSRAIVHAADPRRPGDQHLRDNLPARRSARRPGRAGRGDPIRGGGQGRGDRGRRGQHRADRIGRRRNVVRVQPAHRSGPSRRSSGTGRASRRSPSRRGGSRTCCRRLP